MLVAISDRRRVEARDAERAQSFSCPLCRGAVVLKRGSIRVPHFAHRARAACAWAGGETQGHLRAKTVLRDAFAGRGLRAEVEVVVAGLGASRRADVMVWLPKGHRVAIEVQHTTIGLEEVEQRTVDYVRRGIALIWLPLLRAAVWTDAVRNDGGEAGDYRVQRYAARPWEKWVHGYNFGHLWFYDPERSALWKGRLDRHKVFVEATTWYDQEGEERHAGGDYRFSKRWRELTLWGPYEPAVVCLERAPRKPSRIGPYAYPGGPAAHLVPEGRS